MLSVAAHYIVESNQSLNQRERLHSEEWLSEIDLRNLLQVFHLEREVKTLPLSKQIIPGVDTDTILHPITTELSQRLWNANPITEAMTLAFLLNVGGGLTSQGLHWLNLYVLINPNTHELQVFIKDGTNCYSALAHELKTVLNNELTRAKNEIIEGKNYTVANRRFRVDALSELTAHQKAELVREGLWINPDNLPQYLVTGFSFQSHSTSQSNGWQCGYNAFHDLMNHPYFAEQAKKRVHYSDQEFLKAIQTCQGNTPRLRDLIYRQLLGPEKLLWHVNESLDLKTQHEILPWIKEQLLEEIQSFLKASTQKTEAFSLVLPKLKISSSLNELADDFLKPFLTIHKPPSTASTAQPSPEKSTKQSPAHSQRVSKRSLNLFFSLLLSWLIKVSHLISSLGVILINVVWRTSQMLCESKSNPFQPQDPNDRPVILDEEKLENVFEIQPRYFASQELHQELQRYLAKRIPAFKERLLKENLTDILRTGYFATRPNPQKLSSKDLTVTKTMYYARLLAQRKKMIARQKGQVSAGPSCIRNPKGPFR